VSSARRTFLFTTFDGGGNVAPVMSAVAALVERGHDVRVMSDETSRQEAELTRARFVPWRRAPNKTVRSRDTDPPDWSVSPKEGLRMMAEHFMGGCALAYAQDAAAALDCEPVDLVVNFDMLLGVMVACEARHQQFALLSTCISMFPLPGVPPFGFALPPPGSEDESVRQRQVAAELQGIFDTGLPALNVARAELGLPPLNHFVDQANAAALRLLGTARAFDFAPRELPADVRYVGPMVRDPVWARSWVSPWSADDSRPLIVVAFSTSFQNHIDCLQRVIDAAAHLPVRVLVTLGGPILRSEIRAAENTFVVDSAPHERVMRDAAIVVTHGGHGTVMAALMHGVPMLVIPHGRDQGDNAVRITERGAGLCLANTASVGQMRSALQSLWERATFRLRARALGDAIHAEVRNSSLIADLEALAHSSAGRAHGSS